VPVDSLTDATFTQRGITVEELHAQLVAVIVGIIIALLNIYCNSYITYTATNKFKLLLKFRVNY
jgi:hypothetical protein